MFSSFSSFFEYINPLPYYSSHLSWFPPRNIWSIMSPPIFVTAVCFLLLFLDPVSLPESWIEYDTSLCFFGRLFPSLAVVTVSGSAFGTPSPSQCIAPFPRLFLRFPALHPCARRTRFSFLLNGCSLGNRSIHIPLSSASCWL